MSRTSIIISNLSKNDFIASPGHTLLLANEIKLSILNLDPIDTGDFVHSIVHWSELPFLSRIIIIFKTPEAAAHASLFLQLAYKGAGLLTLPATVKLSLQENLLLRSKLSDALTDTKELNAAPALERFRNSYNSATGSPTDNQGYYQEPAPQSFDAYADLQRLGIDVSEFNSEEQLDELRASSENLSRSSSSRELPAPGLGRTRSLTKTLFKPELLVNTGAHPALREPKSPTITLDETF